MTAELFDGARSAGRRAFEGWHAALARWAVLATIYSAIAMALLPLYPTTGDEPHYWIHGQSLIHDFDQALANNYRDNPFAVGPQMPHAFAAGDDWWPFRGHGVALIAAPGTLTGRVGPAMLTMCAVIAALWLPLFAYVRRELGAGWATEWLCLAYALALPFAAAAGRLYPDLPSGMLTAIAVAQIGSQLRQPSTMVALGFGLAVAALPLMYWRHVPTVGLLVTLWLIVAQLRGFEGPRSSLWRMRLSALGLPLVSAVTAVLYAVACGPVDAARAAGLTAPGLSIVAIETVLGHLLDQGNGLLWQQPLWWVVLVALGWQLRTNPWLAVTVLAVIAAVLVPLGLTSMYYGGAGLIGRYNWGYAALGLVVLAPFLAAHRRWLWPVNIVASVLLLAAAVGVLDSAHGPVLEATNALPVWLRSNLYGSLSTLLPSFALQGQDLQYAVARAAVATACLCLMGGWALAGGRLGVAVVLTLLLALWVARAPQSWPAVPTLHVYALDQIPRHGVLDDGRIRRSSDTDLRPVIYGPYLSPQPGRYRIHLSYYSADPGAVLWVSSEDLAAAADPAVSVVPLPVGYGILSIGLSLDRAWARGEILVQPGGGGELAIFGLAIERGAGTQLPTRVARPFAAVRRPPRTDRILVSDFDRALRSPQRVDWRHWEVELPVAQPLR